MQSTVISNRHRSHSLSPAVRVLEKLPFAPTPAPMPGIPMTAPPMHPLRKVPSAPYTFPDTEHQIMVSDVKSFLNQLNHPYEEIPIFDKHSSLIHSGWVATQKRDSGPWWNIFGSEISWTDTYGILLDNQFLLLEKEENPTGKTEFSHAIRPIRLEYLFLGSFDDEPEVGKYHIGSFKQIGSRFRKKTPPMESMHPFTIYHVAAKITRQYIIYTETKAERNKWNVAFKRALGARKSLQDLRMLYEPQVLNDGFFRIAPRIQFNRGAHYTGRIVSAALFKFEEEDYIAIGCTTGIYISKRAVDYPFVKVLEFNEPNSIVVIPEFKKFLVHCESELSSYPLDKVVRVSQGTAEYKDLGSSAENPAKGDGKVLFVKAVRIDEQNKTVVIYPAKSSGKVTLHVKELVNDSGNGIQAVFKPLGPPVPIPGDPHDATCILDLVAICTSKAIYFVDPMKGSISPDVMPEEMDKKGKKRKAEIPKFHELVDKASILGMVKCTGVIILVYNDLGCFVDIDSNHTNSHYWVEWERKATAFVHSDPFLLLFSPGYVEVRKIEWKSPKVESDSLELKLVEMVRVSGLRHLRSSGLMEGFLGVMAGSFEDDGSRTEKLIKLILRQKKGESSQRIWQNKI